MATEAAEQQALQDLVPQAVFIDDVATFVAGKDTDEVLSELRGNLQKYKYVQQEVLRRHQRLLLKEPEIRKCLDAVKLLLERLEAGEPTVMDFALSSQVFARAKVEKPQAVHLWLGAGVMLEYTPHEAKDLLETQLEACRLQALVAQSESDYLRDQITTTEVSMARVYNHGVAARREQTAVKA